MPQEAPAEDGKGSKNPFKKLGDGVKDMNATFETQRAEQKFQRAVAQNDRQAAKNGVDGMSKTNEATSTMIKSKEEVAAMTPEQKREYASQLRGGANYINSNTGDMKDERKELLQTAKTNNKTLQSTQAELQNTQAAYREATGTEASYITSTPQVSKKDLRNMTTAQLAQYVEDSGRDIQGMNRTNTTLQQEMTDARNRQNVRSNDPIMLPGTDEEKLILGSEM